jgi:hypothetical protein
MATCGRGWGERCPAARGPECKCACGGVNHGVYVTPDEKATGTRKRRVRKARKRKNQKRGIAGTIAVPTPRPQRGFSGTRAAPTPTPPSPPRVLVATSALHDGEIDLSWDMVTGAMTHVIEKSPDPPTATSWTHAGVSIKSEMTISGLTSGARYWFRVAAVGTSGQSGWSDPATKIAP